MQEVLSGRDISGNILLTIPTSKLDDIAGWEKEKLATLFIHMADIAKCLKLAKSNPLAAFHTLPLAFLADLRHASTTVITVLVESLESVEHHGRGTISAIYFLSPKKKSRSQTLKKLLGLKPSKKRPRVPLFKVVIKCIEGCQLLLTRLNSVKDKVDLLQEYDTEGQTSGQLQQLLSDLLDKFHMIISESSLPLHLVQSKQTLFLLEHPSSDNHIAAVHTDLIEGFRTFLRDLYSELDCWNTDLENTWKVTESRLTILIHLQRHKERAREIERKICEHYHPLLREHPIVGKTLSQAELYRAHFTTTLYEPAKELLSQATEILEAVHKLKNGTTLPTGGPSGGLQYTTFFTGLDISDISSCLTTSIQPFTQQLQHLQQVYVNVHIFHLLFEKTLIWYKKVLKFIPETLLDKCTLEPDLSLFDLSFYNLSPQGTESLVYMPTEWLGAVRIFLSRHPPPRQEHIDRLDESIPQLVDRKLKAQARSLALRLRLIQRLLSSTHLPLQLVKAVLGWRAELFGNLHPVGHSVSGSAKQRNKSADNIDSSGGVSSDKLPSEKSQVLSRTPPEKSSGKRKSLGSVELEASIRKSGLPAASHERIVEKALPKKTPTRTMFRTKSVEFNFNSSSTDGSVFDYDRAVNRLQQHDLNHPGGSRDMIKVRAYPRRVRRESQDVLIRVANGGRSVLEEVALSDQSELLKHSHKMSDPRARTRSAAQSYFQTDESLDDLALQSKAKSVSEPETTSLSSATHILPGSQTLPSQTKYRTSENRPSPLSTAQLIPDERFIRLTFTPKESKSHPLQAFKFESLESDTKETTHAQDHVAEEDESTDGAPERDPYDSLVQKIREVSASNMSNTEKLKRVSQLLSASTSKKSPAEDNTDEAGQRLGRFSKSALDLRLSDSRQFDPDDSQGEPSYSPADYQGERPVDAVLRMKRNLAKSLEELNLIGSPIPARTASDHHGKRYISELEIEPIFKYHEKIRETRIQGEAHTESDRHEEGTPKSHATKSTFLISEYQKRRQSSSEVESISPVSNSVSSGGKSQTTALNANSDPHADPRLLDYLSPSLLSHRLAEYDSDDDPRVNSTRTNLSYLASRNFLSPSFLRPAVSMKDLSSRPAATFHLGDPGLYKESELQALEELEMLRTLQEDPLSNEFSKLTPDRKKQTRIFTGDFIDKMKTEPGVNSDDQSTVKSDGIAEAPLLSVPGINVDYISFVDHMDSPTDDGQEAEQLYINDPFDRLATEAEQEHLSQEEVANSLRKTQRILETFYIQIFELGRRNEATSLGSPAFRHQPRRRQRGWHAPWCTQPESCRIHGQRLWVMGKQTGDGTQHKLGGSRHGS
ncbi:hypothetical protein Btru_015325 [Bulinus truncatus]|nr:hypothetical protein Btru_015325 [Bulinus truncatus]